MLAPVLLLAFYYRATHERGGRLRGAFNRLDFRRGWALFGVTLHVEILIGLNVGPFSWISLAYYVCLGGVASRVVPSRTGPHRSSNVVVDPIVVHR